MKSQNPKSIADKYYGDPFSKKIKEGNRCCMFGPSVFKAGIGGAQLLIDKETFAVYEIHSHMGRFGDLPFLDYENKSGLFIWPEEGGAPQALEEKILLKQIDDQRQTNWKSNPDEAKLLAALLDQLAGTYLKMRDAKFSDIEVILLEAIAIQMQNPKLFGESSQTPLDRYLYQLKIKGRLDEKQELESQWEAAKSGKSTPAKSSTASPSSSSSPTIPKTEPSTLPPSAGLEDANAEAEQLMFEAADAEDAQNLKLAEDLYRRAIAIFEKDQPSVSRDNFLMLAYSALGHLLVAQGEFLAATEPLTTSVALYQASEHKQELFFTGTLCLQMLGECLTTLGRTDELEALSGVLDTAGK